MKKTALIGKLSLQRETVLTLNTTDLEGINGGITPGLFMASVRFCAPAAEAARQSAIRSCITCRCR